MADITIDPEIRDLIPPLTKAERAELEASLLVDGCRDALVVWPDRRQGLKGKLRPLLLDGHHRKTICDERGIAYDTVELRRYTREEAMLWVIANQRGRRNLSHFARGELALRALEIEKVRASGRMSDGGKGGNGVPTLERGRARDKAASTMDISGRQLDKVRFIAEHADDETKERLRKGETSVHREHVRLKGAQRKASAQQRVAVEPEPLPDGPFRVIVADPPWTYFLRSEDALHRGRVPYPAMSTQEICDLQVANLAADDCILWLWITNTHLLDGSGGKVLDAWGFEGKTMLTWFKTRLGTGHWMRGQTEHCIMAVRGKPVHTLTGESTALDGDFGLALKTKRREHSRKPDEFYERVEGLCPGSKVELFAREPREGWTLWGAEKDKFAKGNQR